MTRSALPLALIGLALSACSQGEDSANMVAVENVAAVPPPPPVNASIPAPETKPAKIAVNLAPDGLSFVDTGTGKARLIGFGVPRATIEMAADAAVGSSSGKGTSPECGAGAMDFTRYPGDLQLTFQEGKFIGWTINRAKTKAYATASGIGIGSTRKEVESAYGVSVEETSLGTEFGTGSLAGLLDGGGPNAKVTDIWAGTVCILD